MTKIARKFRLFQSNTLIYMSERDPTGHPVAVIAISSFLGELLAGSNNAGTLGAYFGDRDR